MSFLDILTASSIPSIILGILGIIFFKNYLPEKIHHHFQKDIESIKDKLNSQENELNALRHGSLENIAKKEILIFDRTLKELDSLILTFQELKKYLIYVEFFSRLNIVELKKSHENDQEETKKICDVFSGGNTLKNINDVTDRYEIKQLYIPETIFAYFIAYVSIIHYVFITLDLLRTNLKNPLRMYKSEKIFDLIEKTIPGFLKGVSTDNMSIFLPDFLKEVDRLINQEIINFIKLEKVSTDSLKKANEICMAAREMQKETHNIETQSDMPPSMHV
ncbi:hypothetical protein NB639_01440 [Oxalobacter formigenes]|uniref:hypothetical protein n=1 Tax=Oxalobacter formigenes TaxID=847 RepID=UPI0022AF66FB|nr:hypothetical protein [Oxalobacter formigenes]WAW06095.1 hypothetical protein NB639_01440 [Oxalobacter formigenes]